MSRSLASTTSPKPMTSLGRMWTFLFLLLLLSKSPSLHAFTSISSQFHHLPTLTTADIISGGKLGCTAITQCQHLERRQRNHLNRVENRMRCLRSFSTTRLFLADADADSEPSATKEEVEDIPSSSSSSSSSCPFSMTFPRYRVDLSSKKDKNNIETTTTTGVFNIPNPFASMQNQMNRFQIESMYKDNVKGGTFFWADCSTPSIESLGSDDSKKKDDVTLTKSYQQAAINIRAASFFWRQVSNLLLSKQQQYQTNKEEEAVLVFSGGVPKICVRRLMDVLNWYNEKIKDGTLPSFVIGDGEDKKEVMVNAAIDDETSIPTVILTTATTAMSSSSLTSVTLDNKDDEETSARIAQERIQSWVRRLLVELGICPFTKSDKRSGQGLGDLGVPVGKIAYHYSNAGMNCIPTLMADTWAAISEMVDAGPSGKNGISSILLAAPQFDTNFPLWAGPVFAMLESSVTATNSASAIGIVCFHPQYATPDGSSWPGFGHMHSVPRLRTWLEERNPSLSEALSEEEVAAGGAWQRRTPHAVINVLRAEQLEAAEGRRATGVLYAENIRVLVGKDEGIGSDQLAIDLRKEQEMGRK